MVQTISADRVTLYQLEAEFGLRQIESASAFLEWQQELPALTSSEQQRLDRVRAAFANLTQRSVLENTVKLAVVAPLLDLAGLFLPPFYVSTEDEVELTAQEGELTIRGRMDVLVLKEQFWLLVIESKRAEFSLKVGIPQVLSYMLTTPVHDRPLYGLVTNGSNFVFLKLVWQANPRYARSQEFVLENPGDLERVLQVLKRLAAVVGQ
ncbi:restriction endonuclease subunit R [Leptolyngbya sp. NK1-12]|uniref:Restriction endonuclease subunit R n=1 Tax=Leptolyngbya sp. NK1-12 TaxID=2547451 RepID=A0AA96WCQ6_9CYAN|nr:restriction endonuclease subunit R [Leptolyngbya sp. NK1-12]WNZ22678.1 restriction endonuclease subunit R [Leptolyngbya sp. NK1-12]